MEQNENESVTRSCAFIILTHNSGSSVVNCLESVLFLKSLKAYAFVCDNGSEDDTVDKVLNIQNAMPERVFFMQNKINQGTTKPRNALLKIALASADKFDYVCILDSDTIVNDITFSLLVSCLQNNPQITLAAPRMFNAVEQEQMSVKRFPSVRIKFLKAMPIKRWSIKGEKLEKYSFFPTPLEKLSRVPVSDNSISLTSCSLPPFSIDDSIYEGDYAISACWFMRMSDITVFGPLDEHYFYAPEDVDYCAVIKEKGGKVALVSNASIYHLTARISKKKFFSHMNSEHLKGLIYFASKHKGKL